MSNQGSPKPVMNIGDVDLIEFGSPGGRFKASLGRMGPALGAEKLGAMLTIIEPGKRAFPFHAHHAIEEMFFIIEGRGEYRYGEDTYPIREGDLLAAPTGGADQAHQIVNTGDTPLKFLAFSTMDPLDVVEYPDSGKFRAYSQGETGKPEDARLNFIGRAASMVDLFDGEEP